MVDSRSPRHGEKASYYPAVCLETGEVEWMGLEGNSNSGTSSAFLKQLRQRHAGPLSVIWDHAGEAVWGWVREEAAGNLCLGTKEMVEEKVRNFFGGLASRKDEVKRRCRTVLQSRADRLPRHSQYNPGRTANAHSTLALV